MKEEIENLKVIIRHQNEVLRLILEKNNIQAKLGNISDFSTTPESEKPTLFDSSTGNNGVRQTDRQTDRDLVNPVEDSNLAVLSDLTPRQTVRQTDRQLDSQQHPKNSIYSFKDSINNTFESLSKQEQRALLAIYQLEDDGIQEISYWELAQEMKVSESCVRDHIRGLIKKKAPITKKKVNSNLRVLLGISKDFKSLGLKQKLINLYYNTDPDQTKLFEE